MSTRRLAAIMFTDIQGYTALMQENEAHAIILRDRHREVMERLHAQHNGKVVQYYGDGTLSIFDSCVEAVNCALGVQTELQQDPQVPLRIGIHLGDIVERADGVMGDGVNVAARVESLSIPGAILVSQKVADEIKNQPDIPLKSLGTFTFKNVMAPMEVFSVAKDDLVVPDANKLQGKFVKHERPGAKTLIQRMPIWLRFVGGFFLFLLLGPLVYQPLMNLTSRADTITVTDEFGNKIQQRRVSSEEMVRVHVGAFEAEDPEKKVDWLTGGIAFGIDKEWDQDPYTFNKFAYVPEGTSLSARIKNAEKENVQYVLTGKYAQSDSGLWVRAQIYEVATGQLKAEREFEAEDFYSLIDDMSKSLKSDLGIAEENQNQVKDLPFKQYTTASMEALQKYIMAVSSQQDFNKISIYSNQAIQADSTFGMAHYYLAYIYNTLQVSPSSVKHHVSRAMKYRSSMSTLDEIRVRLLDYQVKEQYKKAGQLLEMMTELYPNKIVIWQDKFIHHYIHEEYETALEVLPTYRKLSNDPGQWLREEGSILLYLGREKEGIKKFERFLESNSSRADLWLGLGELYSSAEEWDLAEQAIDKAALLDPENEVLPRMLRHVAFMRDSSALITPEYLEKCSGIYDATIRKFSFEQKVVNGHLVYKAKNQGSAMLFPIAKDTFTMSLYNIIELFKEDSLGNIDRMALYQGAAFGWLPAYKRYDAVNTAFASLDQGKDSLALAQFGAAYEAHPNHFFLGNFIKHLEFKQSEAYDAFLKERDRFIGKFVLQTNQYEVKQEGEDLVLSLANNLNFAEPVKLYPISATTFITTDIKSLNYIFEQEGKKISGMTLYYEGKGAIGTAKKE